MANLIKDGKLKNIWADYWKNYRGVTRIGAWIQRQSLKKAILLLNQEGIRKENRIIDVGCGEGRTLLVFRKEGFKNSIGIDNTQESLNICRKKGLKIGTDIFLCDAKKTKFKNNEFGLVFSEGLLEHFKNPLPIIKEMARISKKYVILIQPNHYSIFGLAIAVLGHLIRNNVREYSFSKKYFVKQFANFGFYLKAEKQTPLNEFFVLLFEAES